MHRFHESHLARSSLKETKLNVKQGCVLNTAHFACNCVSDVLSQTTSTMVRD